MLWAVVFVLGSALVGGISRGLPGGKRRPVLPLRWRARLGLHAGPGMAGDWKLWRSYGLPAARTVAKVARPSLGWWQRHNPRNWRAYATYIGKAHGWVRRRRVYATFEVIVLTFAGPRKGKSAAPADRIIDAPGPVVVTSIRGDLIKNTVGLRSQIGRILVWNPEGIGEEYGTNIRWDPVNGCNDTRVAARRAGYMVEAQTARGLSDYGYRPDWTAILAGPPLAAASSGPQSR